MKQKAKKLTAIMLAVTAILTSLSLVFLGGGDLSVFVRAQAADAESVLTFKKDNDRLYVTDCDTSASGVLTIPETYNGETVYGIDSGAFDGCTEITEIVIPAGVWGIGFDEDDNGYNSGYFSDCTSLQTITVDKNNSHYSSVDGVLFEGPKLLKYPPCKADKSYTVPSSISYICQYAFEGSNFLEEVSIPSSLEVIYELVFQNCKALKKFTVEDGGKLTIAEHPFDGFIFDGCDSLEEIKFSPNTCLCYFSEKSIYFANLKSLKNITLPAIFPYERKISDRAFAGLQNLENVEFLTIDGRSAVTSIGDSAFADCPKLKSVILPDSITKMGEGTFWGCSSLENVNIPSGLEEIPDYTFCESGITQIEIPEGVKKIGIDAFAGCTMLKSITFPDSVTEIGTFAFCECTKINGINISKNVEKIDDFAFAATVSSEYINVDPENKNYSSVDGVLFNKDMTELINYPAKKAGDEYIVPDTVTRVDTYSFVGCDNLRSITFPESVVLIDCEAVESCALLKDVYILNRECEIVDNEFTIEAGVIHGYTGSGAEAYAKKYNRTFVALDAHVHTPVEMPAVAPTCTVSGLTQGQKCSDCGEILVEQKTVPAVGHTEVTDAAVAASCTSPGKTEGKHCSVCSEVLIAQKTVDALGHRDSDGDGKCDVCGAALHPEKCRHICHSENKAAKFFWKIICFFDKFFKTNRFCSCGISHW